MRERVDQFGVAEPELLRTGQNQIEVNLPGVDDAERAARQVGTTAQLYFYDWEPNVLDEQCRTNPEQVNGGQTPVTGLYNAVKRASECEPQVDRNNTTDGPIFYAFDETSKQPLNDGIPEEDREALEEDLADQGLLDTAEILEVPEGVVVVRNEDQRAPEQQEAGPVDAWWVMRDNPVLNGTDIRNPEQTFDQQGGGEPIVTMEFSDEGRRAFAATTAEIAQRGADNAALNGGLQNPIGASHHFAIRLDNELISTPFINFRELPDGIDGRDGAQISGGFTINSAQDLANLLKIGALPLRLELISRSQVSATLGQQALDQGLVAGLAGFGIVAIFLIVFYRVLGVIATLALGVYAIYLFALIKLIPITLTLPGIAGLVLTIGVAADANIVIFERVKEEIRAGRSVSAGIEQGYKKGFSTILDANIVTLLVAFILFILATAGVKGFAFVLGIGTLVSLFTAVLATQAILLSMRNTRILRSPSALGAGKPRKPITFDFMGASKWFFSASGVILLICGLAIGANGLNFGIDFESGTRITAALERGATVEDVRDAIAPAGFGDAEVQTVENAELGRQRRPDLRRAVRPHGRGHGRAGRGVRPRRRAQRAGDRAHLRRDRGQLRAHRDHRVAHRHLHLHLAALRVEVRRAGADRADARRPHHRGRLLPGRLGGDDVDGRGAAHHPGLLALRHDHRVRPDPRERAAHAERRVLPDRQPVDERGHRALAGHELLHHPARSSPCSSSAARRCRTSPSR